MQNIYTSLTNRDPRIPTLICDIDLVYSFIQAKERYILNLQYFMQFFDRNAKMHL